VLGRLLEVEQDRVATSMQSVAGQGRIDWRPEVGSVGSAVAAGTVGAAVGSGMAGWKTELDTVEVHAVDRGRAAEREARWWGCHSHEAVGARDEDDRVHLQMSMVERATGAQQAGDSALGARECEPEAQCGQWAPGQMRTPWVPRRSCAASPPIASRIHCTDGSAYKHVKANIP
jgi:hypothetical protein